MFYSVTLQLAECIADWKQIINSNNFFTNGQEHSALVTGEILFSNLLQCLVKGSILDAVLNSQVRSPILAFFSFLNA